MFAAASAWTRDSHILHVLPGGGVGGGHWFQLQNKTKIVFRFDIGQRVGSGGVLRSSSNNNKNNATKPRFLNSI